MPILEAAPSFDAPFPFLLACHERIRAAFARVVRCAEAHAEVPADTTPAVALRAAQDALAELLPRHAADEERSFFSRAIARDPGHDVRELITQIEREHADIDGHLFALEHWRRDVGTPGDLTERVRALGASLNAHFDLEETELSPKLRALLDREPERSEIGREMAARRGVAWGAQPDWHIRAEIDRDAAANLLRLSQEHMDITARCHVAKKLCKAANAGAPFDAAAARPLLAAIRAEFGRHGALEEADFFPWTLTIGAEASEVSALVAEHETVRPRIDEAIALVGEVARGQGDAGAARQATEWVAREVFNHAVRENRGLFKRAADYFADSDGAPGRPK